MRIFPFLVNLGAPGSCTPLVRKMPVVLLVKVRLIFDFT